MFLNSEEEPNFLNAQEKNPFLRKSLFLIHKYKRWRLSVIALFFGPLCPQRILTKLETEKKFSVRFYGICKLPKL